MRDIKKIIIHCSDSDNARYDFEAIKNDHVGINGWSDIGYHLGIDHDANIQVLRPIDRGGAHTKGENFDSIGICVLGRSIFSVEQKRKLAEICSMLLIIFELSEDDIYPHNYFNKLKTCPNFDLEEWKVSYLQDLLCL